MGKRYRKREDQKQKPQDFAKRGQDLNQNLKSFQKIVNWERWRVNWCNLNVSQTRVWWQSPRRCAIFWNVLEKISILRPFGSHFARLSIHLESLNF